MRFILLAAAVMSCALLLARPAVAEAIVVAAGETHSLSADLVLRGDDVLRIEGTAEKPATLRGNRHRLLAEEKWSGSVQIKHCRIVELGGLPKRDAANLVSGPGPNAIDLKVAGKGTVAIEYCTFDGCAAVRLQLDGSSAAKFCFNTVLESTVVATSKDVDKSGDAFHAAGNSPEPKLFQGNFIPRGKVVIRGANWLIGGDTDAESNLFLGLRIGVNVEGKGTVVRGNYFHLRMPINEEFPYWSQVSVVTTGRDVVCEHNVIRDGEWIVRFVAGEFRYNVISDIIDHDLMQNGSNGRIHHNLFLAGTSDSRPGSMMGCIAVIYPPRNGDEGIEIFNNVFDGGGRLNVPAIEVASGAVVKSVRNNVFTNFAHSDQYYKRPHGMIRTTWNYESTKETPPRLGYADYNLFHSPLAKTPRNYLLSVKDKTVRTDAGFGLNDVPRGGKLNEQAEPKFVGPLPKAFPFADEEIRDRKVGVSKMLAFYAAAYSPAKDSPLIGSGDPADGKSTNIGAIGDGQFGSWGQK